MNQSGIYEIVNTANGKRYIGSAKDFSTRERQHRYGLRHGKHHSVALQRAWNKYGEDAFKFVLLLICAPTKEQLYLYEQLLFDWYKPEYNMAPAAESCLGIKRDPDTVLMIAAKRRGKKQGPHSAEHRAAISAATVGRVISQEQREQISRTLTGRKLGPHSPEHRAAIGDANRGKVRSEEARAAMSQASAAYWARVRSGETQRG